MRDRKLHLSEEDLEVEPQTSAENGKSTSEMEDPSKKKKKTSEMEEEVIKASSENASLVGINDTADEFFDVSEPQDYDESENSWPSDFGSEMYYQDICHAKLSTTAGFVKKLHILANCSSEEGLCGLTAGDGYGGQCLV